MAFWDAGSAAGHVQEAFAGGLRSVSGPGWLREAADLLRGDAAHEASCGRACMRCLLDADTQRDLLTGLLDRVEGLALAEALTRP